jgi:tetratricopeptide (TPR) repeat protein
VPDNIDIALVELPETIETCDPVGFGLLPDGNSNQKVKFDFFGFPQFESHPDDVNVRQGYLALVGNNGNPKQKEQAIIQTNTWLESHPDDVNVRQSYLALVGNNGNPKQKEQAVIQTNTWLESHPDDVHIRGIISLFFGYYRDYLDYETCYQLAESLEFIHLPTDQWQIKIYIANFFRDYGELERAKNLYLSIIKGANYQIKNKNDKSLEKTLDFASLNHAYLLLLLTPPQWDEAIRKLHWLLSKKPEHSLINLYLAKAYQAKAKSYLQFSSKQIHQQAIDYYKKAIQYDQQKNGYFWYKFGCFYRESMNNIPQAITCFKNSIRAKY